MKLTDQHSIPQRVEILEDALAKVLNRDISMYVGADSGVRYVWVRDTDIDPYVGHDLSQIARELEVLLS